MDINTLLPLLMQQRGGGTDNSQNAQASAPSSEGLNALLGSLASGKKLNPMELMGALGKNNPQNSQALNMVSALSSMRGGHAGNKKNRPVGLKPIRAIAPDLILGRLIKYFNA